MKATLSLFVILVLAGASSIANAQSRRSPTPAERAALQKTVNALNLITNSLEDNNWVVEDNNFDPELVVPSGARSHCGIGYTIRLGLKDGSPAYHKVMDPLTTYIQSGQSDSRKLESLENDIEKSSTVTIDIDLNGGSIGFGTDRKNNTQLNVPGAAKAFIEAEDNNNPSNDGAYVLAFGNWKDAKYDAGNNVLRFRFQHPPQTPYTENITIQLRGNDGKIREIIHKADWNSLNAAITQ